MLADYLGISRVHVALSETGRRELPIPALIKLGVLERSLLNNVQYKQPFLQTQSGKDLTAIRQHVKKCRHRAGKETKKLVRLQQQYQHCLKVLMAIGYLQNNPLPGNDAKKDQIWIDLLQAQVVKKLNSCGLAAQVKIKLTVQALEMQAEQAGAMKF